MTQRSRAGRHLILAVSLAVFAVGCADQGDEEGAPPLGDVPTITRSADIPALPSEGLRLTKEQYVTLMRANRIAVNQCMAQFGFGAYSLVEGGDDPAYIEEVYPKRSRLFGVVDEDEAATRGYQPPPTTGSGKTKTGLKDPSAAEQAVFDGTNAGKVVGGKKVPAGGCVKQADDALFAGGNSKDDVLSRNEFVPLEEKVRADERLRDAFGKWSACMKESGYSYEKPMDAGNDKKWGRGGTPSAAETATARADVACKKKTNVVGVWWAVKAAYEKQKIDAEAEHFASVRRTREAVIRNTARIVAHGR
ncbi:hypothetical protein [Streptomyces sp. NPDC003077]|uniref:hypothetical protein n=1 Tax=Streptomyces sp. NPDC003077 TaxID=3154443 RepID=UPI00339FEE50